MSDTVVGEILIRRGSAWVDRFRRYTLRADGDVVGKVRDDEDSVVRLLSPGAHVLRLSIDWCSSPPLEVFIRPGARQTIHCGSSVRGWRILFAIVYITVFAKRYLWLHPAPSAGSEDQT